MHKIRQTNIARGSVSLAKIILTTVMQLHSSIHHTNIQPLPQAAFQQYREILSDIVSSVRHVCQSILSLFGYSIPLPSIFVVLVFSSHPPAERCIMGPVETAKGRCNLIDCQRTFRRVEPPVRPLVISRTGGGLDRGSSCDDFIRHHRIELVNLRLVIINRGIRAWTWRHLPRSARSQRYRDCVSRVTWQQVIKSETYVAMHQ
jgi:hypothetical protein